MLGDTGSAPIERLSETRLETIPAQGLGSRGMRSGSTPREEVSPMKKIRVRKNSKYLGTLLG